MHFRKKDVNLLFAVLSLIIISYFFIGIYIPITKETKILEKDIFELNNYYRSAKSTMDQEIYEPKSYETLYKEKLEELNKIFPNELNREEIIVTIEDNAKKMKIDISKFDISLNSNQNNQITNTEGLTEEQMETAQISNLTASDEISVDLTIHGEYRSIIMFLFKLQNLEYKNSITNFNLEYYSDAKSNQNKYNSSFPLEASFRITFYKNGGEN